MLSSAHNVLCKKCIFFPPLFYSFCVWGKLIKAEHGSSQLKNVINATQGRVQFLGLVFLGGGVNIIFHPALFASDRLEENLS